MDTRARKVATFSGAEHNVGFLGMVSLSFRPKFRELVAIHTAPPCEPPMDGFCRLPLLTACIDSRPLTFASIAVHLAASTIAFTQAASKVCQQTVAAYLHYQIDKNEVSRSIRVSIYDEYTNNNTLGQVGVLEHASDGNTS
jgi:hypothetical protein